MRRKGVLHKIEDDLSCEHFLCFHRDWFTSCWELTFSHMCQYVQAIDKLNGK